jgi:hypothetical protein
MNIFAYFLGFSFVKTKKRTSLPFNGIKFPYRQKRQRKRQTEQNRDPSFDIREKCLILFKLILCTTYKTTLPQGCLWIL